MDEHECRPSDSWFELGPSQSWRCAACGQRWVYFRNPFTGTAGWRRKRSLSGWLRFGRKGNPPG